MSDKLVKTAKSELSEAHVPVLSPPVDIYENEKEIILEADMPGVEQKSLEVTLDDNILSISGRQTEIVPEGFKALHNGYGGGIYKRSFTLLSDFDGEKISAKMNNGVLKIVMPKQEKALPRKITVHAD